MESINLAVLSTSDGKEIFIPDEIFVEIFGKLEIILIWHQLFITTLQTIKDNVMLRSLRQLLIKPVLYFEIGFFRLGFNGTILNLLLKDLYNNNDDVKEIIIPSTPIQYTLDQVDFSIFKKVNKLKLHGIHLNEFKFPSENVIELEMDWVTVENVQLYGMLNEMKNLKKLAHDDFDSFDFCAVQLPNLEEILSFINMTESKIIELFNRFKCQLKTFKIHTREPSQNCNFLHIINNSCIPMIKLETVRMQLNQYEADELEINMFFTPNLKKIELAIYTQRYIIYEIRDNNNKIISSRKGPKERIGFY